ncbi:GNAT family N-acetyltransferase [Sphingobacterium griseoflavum]|uniref:N-acetyltransferase n=1 Tax=Sphingobacterium griseoflavum TaxID=1474952 RepID=A0ABQ3HP98_9SPHI|nr:GNAT family N-acetyltransferase [Sphingobacterium griseoflavum]GHE23058.1 N-acetyltransferase [Sphingobacterium griseoflavum]
MIQIRKADRQEAQALATLMLHAMQDIVFHFIGESDAQKAHAFLSALISRPGNQYSYEHIVVAEEDGILLGQICCYPGAAVRQLRAPVLNMLANEYGRDIDPALETQAGEIYVDSLAVSPPARGKGIGKILLLYAIDLYCKQQDAILGLLVDEENPKAKKLYLQLGFREVDQKNIFGREMLHLQYWI